MGKSHASSASLIDRVLARATKKRASPAWLQGGIDYYEISAAAAGRLVREAWGAHKKPPRPGYAIDLPETSRTNDKGWSHRGHWTVSNWGGKYELQFHYKVTY